MRIRRVILGSIAIAIATALSACATIPLSTALRFSSLEPSTLAQVDPAQVRVKLSVSLGYEVDIPKSRLKLTVTDSGDVSRSADMPLGLLVRTVGMRSTGFFGSDVSVTTYEAALTAEGVRQLQALQKSLLTIEGGTFEFDVSAPFSKTPPEPQEVNLWADLKLSSNKSYLPLINGAKLRFSKEAGG